MRSNLSQSEEEQLHVVKIDAEQDVNSGPPAGTLAPPKKTTIKRRKVPKRKPRVVSAPREKPSVPVSFRLTREESQALAQSAAVKGKRSKSQAIRMAIKQFVARNGQVQVPSSLAVVDDVYPATIYDDVVELTNQLRRFEFLLHSLADRSLQSEEAEQLRFLLQDAGTTLGRIAGTTVGKL